MSKNNKDVGTEDSQSMIDIDGTNYNIDELSDVSKKHIINIRVADQEIVKLNQKIALAQTARNAYANALKSEIQID